MLSLVHLCHPTVVNEIYSVRVKYLKKYVLIKKNYKPNTYIGI